MNKSHLINHVADELRTSKLQAALLVETVLDGIKKGPETDQSVTLTGFGTFQLKARKARGAIPTAVSRSRSVQAFGSGSESAKPPRNPSDRRPKVSSQRIGRPPGSPGDRPSFSSASGCAALERLELGPDRRVVDLREEPGDFAELRSRAQ